ncbi:Ff.00g054200.m01.CDS01 [Fusarium sp. VM40]|nr:Ff.00g054200.m01.CDS01 [Fusarium sp. VM40]
MLLSAQDIIDARMGLSENRSRGRDPTDIAHLVYGPQPGKQHRLWIKDRILEPQTLSHFLEFTMTGNLPGDRLTPPPLLTPEEVDLLKTPASEWAPTPYNQQTRSTLDWMVIRIGSEEDSSRLYGIAKELHAMKSRLWEGIPPLSERRWQELRLDEPENFTAACSYFAMVIDVFAYLNNLRTKGALRQTFNLIWDHLRVYEQALNAKRREDSTDGAYQEVSVTGLWYSYIRAHYDLICENAHHWVTEHIDQNREPIVHELAHHHPDNPNHYDHKQQDLRSKLDDLNENTFKADFMIFMPTDGYKGDRLPAKDTDLLTPAHMKELRTEPITSSANMMWRVADYTERVKYLGRKEMREHCEREDYRSWGDVPNNDPEKLLLHTISLIDAQRMARHELRGLPQPPEVDRWIEYTRLQKNFGLGFVAYRLCHDYEPATWDLFKRTFEADVADWGRGKVDVNDIRRACKIHWKDGLENGIADGDIEGAKKHFSTVPGLPVHKRVFLAIDESTMKSFLEPTVNNQRSVLAVDVKYEPGQEEDVDSPGYPGTLRILCSLLWDELGAMLVMQSTFPQGLWPMATSNPEMIYVGTKLTPVLKFPSYQETLWWEIARYLVPKRVLDKRAKLVRK